MRLILAIVCLFAFAMPARAQQADPSNIWVLTLSTGEVRVQLRPDLAPQHVARIKLLTRQGFYNGLTFHRVVAGFMAQGGDPTGTGMGSSSEPNLPAEFSAEPFVLGTVGMARSTGPDSANSQFFIMLRPASSFAGQQTAFGQVISGMEAVTALPQGSPPAQPGRILSARILGDVANR